MIRTTTSTRQLIAREARSELPVKFTFCGKKMKESVMVPVIVLSGCLVGCGRPSLSQDIVGRWEITHFDAHGTPMTGAVVMAEFMTNGTWVSEARDSSGTNRYHGTYSVSGNQLTLRSSDGGEPQDWDRYRYSRGILESIGSERKNTARKIDPQNKTPEHIPKGRRRPSGNAQR